MRENAANLEKGRVMAALANSRKIAENLDRQLDEIRKKSDENTAAALRDAEKAAKEMRKSGADETALRKIAEDLYRAAERENAAGTRANAALLAEAANRLKDNLKDPNPGKALNALEQALQTDMRKGESVRRTLQHTLEQIRSKQDALQSAAPDIR